MADRPLPESSGGGSRGPGGPRTAPPRRVFAKRAYRRWVFVAGAGVLLVLGGLGFGGLVEEGNGGGGVLLAAVYVALAGGLVYVLRENRSTYALDSDGIVAKEANGKSTRIPWREVHLFAEGPTEVRIDDLGKLRFRRCTIGGRSPVYLEIDESTPGYAELVELAREHLIAAGRDDLFG